MQLTVGAGRRDVRGLWGTMAGARCKNSSAMDAVEWIANGAALERSGTQENAWGAGEHAEFVTRTTSSVRGGAVCRPFLLLKVFVAARWRLAPAESGRKAVIGIYSRSPAGNSIALNAWHGPEGAIAWCGNGSRSSLDLGPNGTVSCIQGGPRPAYRHDQ